MRSNVHNIVYVGSVNVSDDDDRIDCDAISRRGEDCYDDHQTLHDKHLNLPDHLLIPTTMVALLTLIHYSPVQGLMSQAWKATSVSPLQSPTLPSPPSILLRLVREPGPQVVLH